MTTKYYECPTCHYGWEEESSFFQLSLKVANKPCEYCASHPNMSEKEVLERYFSIMGATNQAHMPEMLKKLWEYMHSKEFKDCQPPA